MINRDIARYRKIVTKINKLENQMISLAEVDFAVKTKDFQMRLQKGEKLDQLLPEAFALVREAIKRTLKLRAYNVQLQGAISIHEGNITEMKTGEGKTLTIIFSAYLNALTGAGVHVVTSNDYLAERDATETKAVYQLLGISTDFITAKTETFDRQVAYRAEVTYVTNNEIGFDFLKDNLLYDKKNKKQRGFNYAIIDEADSVLIDAAQIPLVISDNQELVEKDSQLYLKINPLIKELKEEEDFILKPKEKMVELTPAGIKKLEVLLGVNNIYEKEENNYLYYVTQLLKAHHLFHRDKEYIVENGEAVIVDEFTGRLMHAHRYYQGLHQAIEAKEGLTIQGENKTLASITFQHLFKKYKKLSGLTGTAKSSAKEFRLIYGKKVVVIPTNKKIRRIDKKDRFFLTWEEKLKYITWLTQGYYFKERAVLIGSRSVFRSTQIGRSLLAENVPNQVLNAKHTQREAEIIAQAGQAQKVTVATNMAGRGTDIKLAKSVAEKGGLIVLGAERHNTRRIDNQLIGRAGRQGDPGETQFLISAEDELIKTFFQEKYVREFRKHSVGGKGLEHPKLQKIINRAQKRMEEMFFSQRILSYEFDRITEKHRQVFYRQRERVLNDDDLREETLGLIKGEIYRIINKNIEARKPITTAQIESIILALKAMVINPWFKPEWPEKINGQFTVGTLRQWAYDSVEQYYQMFENYIDSKKVRELERIATLKVLDLMWVEHQQVVEDLQQVALINSISRNNFFDIYEIQMGQAFRKMFLTMPRIISRTIFRIADRLLKKQAQGEPVIQTRTSVEQI